MNSVTEIAILEARVLIHDPDRGLCLIQTSGPRGDLRIELLNLGVVTADSERDDLRDL